MTGWIIAAAIAGTVIGFPIGWHTANHTHPAASPTLPAAGGWRDRIAAALVRLAHRIAGGHVYLSTGCLHGDHDYCQNMTGLAGKKRPATCKFCKAPCICGCHQT